MINLHIINSTKELHEFIKTPTSSNSVILIFSIYFLSNLGLRLALEYINYHLPKDIIYAYDCANNLGFATQLLVEDAPYLIYHNPKNLLNLGNSKIFANNSAFYEFFTN